MRPHNLLKTKLVVSFIITFFISCTADSDFFEYAIEEDIAENIEEQEESENSEEDSSEESESDNPDSPDDSSSGDGENDNSGSGGDETPEDDGNKTDDFSLTDYGVIGDGVTDDTNALQAAFDSGNNLIANPNSSFKVTSTLRFNKSGNQSINWNGSTIEVGTSNLVTFIIDKPNGGLTSMENLLLEGNEIGQDGFQISSPIEFDNVDVQNLYSATNAPQAFAIFFDENFEQNSTMTNCDCTNLNGYGNNVIGDAIGATRCFGFYVGGIPSARSTFIVRNFDFGEVWSEDGDVIEILDTLFEHTGKDIGETYSPLLIDTGTVSNWGRRGLKGTGGGYVIRNVVFNPADATNPKLPNSSKLGPSGIIAMGHTYFPAGSGSNGTYGIASGGIIENCTFNGSTYDTQVILTRSDNLIFRNNILNNSADLQFQQNPRNIYICNNQFGAGSVIYEQGAVFSPNLSNIMINTDNTFVESNYNQLSTWNSTESSFSCN